jgi:hypothetical protein
VLKALDDRIAARGRFGSWPEIIADEIAVPISMRPGAHRSKP